MSAVPLGGIDSTRSSQSLDSADWSPRGCTSAAEDPLTSHLSLSHHNLATLRALISSIQLQHASLALALSNLHRVNTGTSSSLALFLEGAQPTLERYEALLGGWEAAMDAVGRVGVVAGLLMRGGAGGSGSVTSAGQGHGHARDASAGSAVALRGGEDRQRVLGDYVSRDKMLAVRDGCAKVLGPSGFSCRSHWPACAPARAGGAGTGRSRLAADGDSANSRAQDARRGTAGDARRGRRRDAGRAGRPRSDEVSLSRTARAPCRARRIRSRFSSSLRRTRSQSRVTQPRPARPRGVRARRRAGPSPHRGARASGRAQCVHTLPDLTEPLLMHRDSDRPGPALAVLR